MSEVEVEALKYALAADRTEDRGRARLVEDVEHPGEVTEEVRRGIAEYALDRRAHVVEVRGRLQDEAPHDIGRLLGKITEPELALGQLDLGVVTFGDVSADGKHLGCPVGCDQVPIDPLQPLARRIRDGPWRCVDQGGAVGAQYGEL